MKPERMERAFEACWSAMLQGQPLEASLSAYPDLADDLRPLLMAARAARDAWETEPAAGEASARSRARVLRHASSLRRAASAPSPRRAWQRLALVGAALLLLFTFSGAGLVAASAQSLPGDRLYAFKLAAEQVQIKLLRDPAAQISLLSSFDRRRVDEVMRLLVLGRTTRVHFEGHLDSVSGDLYTVSGIPVLSTADTNIAPGLSTGDYVGVDGVTQADGWVLAARIQHAGSLFEGIVESMGPSMWTVSGRTLRLAPDAQIDGGIALGDRVQIQLHTEAGLTSAVSIHWLEHAAESPTGIPSPVVQATATAVPELEPSDTSQQEQESETPEAETPEPEELTSITFSGQVESQSQTNWTVDGRSVAITGQTEMEGNIGVGDQVEVSALRAPDGSLTATQIKLAESNGDGGGNGSEDNSSSEFEFTGRVQSIGSSQWVIDDRTVAVNSKTEIDGSPEVGDEVKVKVFTKSDGGLVASTIEKMDSGSEEHATTTPEHDD